MKRFLSSLIGVLGVAALLIGINMLAEQFLAGEQLDLTEQQLYTLSPSTYAVLAGLKEPITLRLYYSAALGGRIPQYGLHADHVREMLREYADLSDGKIKLEFDDPEPFSDAEDRAASYGLQGVPLDQGGDKVFFGLEGNNLLDDERTIAFFQPERERFLEYDLTKLVYELSSPTRATIGVMTALPMDGDPQKMMMRQGGGAPWAAMLGLRESFAVHNIATTATEIDPDVQVLLVVHPQNLSDATLYAIDQFVMRGGRLLAMVAPANETLGPDPQTGAPPAVVSSDLGKLFKAWGIDYDPDLIVGDLDGAWKVRASGDDEVQAVDYVGYFSLRDGINHDDPATADLREINLAEPGFIDLKPGTDLTITPLLTSSAASEALPAALFRDNPDPARILASFRPDGQRRVIAARLRGAVHSAFDKAPEGAKEAFLPESDGPVEMVVIADTDMLSDRFWTRTQDFFGTPQATPFADNGAFVGNLVGTLAGGDALIGLRSRGSVDRPFVVVDAMQRTAEARYRQTETALNDHLQETTKKLEAISGGQDGSSNAAMNEAQRQAVEDLRHDLVSTRVKLRSVQLELRRDIATLQTELQVFNIALVPGLLLILAVVMGLLGQLRRRRRSA